MDRKRHWVEPLICCTGATVSLFAFYANEPFSMRDGFFFGALVDDYPYFLLTPVLAIAGIYAGWSRPRFRIWAIAILMLYLLLPETYRFAGYWFTHLNPMHPIPGVHRPTD